MEGCPCPACAAGLTRGYLRYLARARELTAMRLLTVHNLAFVERVMRRLREAIGEGRWRRAPRRCAPARRRDSARGLLRVVVDELLELVDARCRRRRRPRRAAAPRRGVDVATTPPRRRRANRTTRSSSPKQRAAAPARRPGRRGAGGRSAASRAGSGAGRLRGAALARRRRRRGGRLRRRRARRASAARAAAPARAGSGAGAWPPPPSGWWPRCGAPRASGGRRADPADAVDQRLAHLLGVG